MFQDQKHRLSTEVIEGFWPSSSSSAIDSRAGQIFSPVDATKPAIR